MIDVENSIAKFFCMAVDRCKESSDMNVKLRLIGRRSRDGRVYNLPTCFEVAALIVGNFLFKLIFVYTLNYIFIEIEHKFD